MADVEARKQKMEELRRMYLRIIDSNIEEQVKKDMNEAAKKLRVLRNIIVDKNDVPEMDFILRTELILKKLTNRRQTKMDEVTVVSTTFKSEDNSKDVVKLKKVESRSNSVESCPRSPSPEKDIEFVSGGSPKLIPAERRSSLLSLPMPSMDDSFSDEEITRPQTPIELPKPIANIIYGSNNSSTRWQTEDLNNAFVPPDFEEPLSPPKLDIDLNTEDDDDLVIDEVIPKDSTLKSPPEVTQPAPPPPPLKPPPKPPSFLTLGMNELASLADNPVAVDQPKPPTDNNKSAEIYIPGRQMSRVPCSLLASKTGTTKIRPSPARVPPSPAYTSIDMFSTEQLSSPKYQFGPSSKPVSVCPPLHRANMDINMPAPSLSNKPDLGPQSNMFTPPFRSRPSLSDPRQRIMYPPPPPQPPRDDRPQFHMQPRGSHQRDPRFQGSRHNFAESWNQPERDKFGNIIAPSYRQHKEWKAEQARRERELQKMQDNPYNKEMSLAERKRLEAEERRRKEATQRQEEHGIQERSVTRPEEKSTRDVFPRKPDIVKYRSLAKPASRVQIIDALPAPASEMKKTQKRVNDERRSSSESESSSGKEKYAEISLEKVSPLNSLYGEMPQPRKGITRIPKIPKKPSAARSRRPPSPPREPTPSPPPPLNEVHSDNENSKSPKSSAENLEKVARADKKSPEQKDNPESNLLMLSDDILKEKIRLMMQAEQKETPSTSNRIMVSSLPSSEHLKQLVRSVIQEELSKCLPLVSPEAAKSADVLPDNKEAEAGLSASGDAEILDLNEPVTKEDSRSKEHESIPENKEGANKPDHKENDSKPDEAIPIDNTELEMMESGTTSEADPVPESSKTENYDLTQAVANELRKQRLHKKSELDLLKENLKDSFIVDDVIKAVGTRQRHPVERYSAPSKEKAKSSTQAIVVLSGKEESEEITEENIEKTRKLVVKIVKLAHIPGESDDEERVALPTPPRRAVARRGKPFGRLCRPKVIDKPECKAPADQQAEDSASDFGSEDTCMSTDFSSRGMSPSRRGRGGRSRGGRRGRRSYFDGYLPRENPTLIDPEYVLKPQEVQKCLICEYEGKKPVDHYVTNHPESEVLISRLPKDEIVQALQQLKTCTSSVLQCRFCHVSSFSQTDFYDHVTEHTGEYRFKCPKCDLKRTKRDTIASHIRGKHHGKGGTPICLSAIDMQESENYVAGYVCGFCNFVQLSKVSMMKHIENNHQKEPYNVRSAEADFMEINMSRVQQQEADEGLDMSQQPTKVKEEVTSIQKQRTEEEMDVDGEEDHFMAMLDNLMQDTPKDKSSGKSILESIRRSKTKQGESSEVKKIDIGNIQLPTTPRLIREPSPDLPEEVVNSLQDSYEPSVHEKQEQRKRGRVIVGICYACGHTEGQDINNLFQHIKDQHPPDKKGNCPDCSRPLNGTDKAIKHMIEEHVPVGVREALLNFWKPQPVGRKKPLPDKAVVTAETEEDTNTVPIEEQPKAFQHARAVKNSAVYASMLEPGRLQKLYKCMARNCSFSTVMPEKLVKHIDKHKSLTVGRIKDWQECVYCMEKYESGQQLVDHIHQEHNKFVYQCSLCFYRGGTVSSISVHQKLAHSVKENAKIYKCQKEEPKVDQPSFTGVIGKYILPYKCANDSCEKTIFKTDEFERHLKDDHQTLEEYQCHECNALLKNPEQLIEHYKSHAYNAYQCLLCKFAASSETFIFNHMCKHANFAPCFAIRSLLCGRSEKNPLAGALRQMEVKTCVPIYQPPLESDTSDSEESDEEVTATAEPLPPSPSNSVFSRTLDAIDKVKKASSTSSTDFAFPLIQTVLKESVPVPPVIENTPTIKTSPKIKASLLKPSVVATPEPFSSKLLESAASTATPDAPPPVTLPLSTFSRAQGIERPYGNSEESSTLANLEGHELYICCGCDFTADNRLEFTDHLSMCNCASLFCVHCKKHFRQVSPLVEHLNSEHGPLRFHCGACDDFKGSNLNVVKKHLRQVHNINQVITKALNPLKCNEDVDHFQVIPKVGGIVRTSSKSDLLQRYGPEDESKLPKTPIFMENALCALCEFKTRVRSNMTRHLKEHAERGVQVGTAGIPINPMPCLKNNEKHFDKMNNWAQSSHNLAEQALLSSNQPNVELPEEISKCLPVHIVDQARYACGVPTCNYKSLDVEMLKNHMTLLHDDITEIACIHCSSQDWLEVQDKPLIDMCLHHMTLHGPNLFLCLACRHFEATRSLISKHTLEEHDLEDHFQVIREERLDELRRTWCCSECKQTRYSFEDIKLHCNNMHFVDFQFKCSLCDFRSGNLSQIVNSHFPKEHTGKPPHAFASFYQIGANMPGVTVGVPTVSPTDGRKTIRMIRVEEVVKPGSIKKTTSPEKKRPPKVSGKEKIGVDIPDPIGRFYVCPHCLEFKNRQESVMMEHIYKEIFHKKFVCKECQISVYSKSSLLLHLRKKHNIISDDPDSHILIHIWPEAESWVKHVLQTQSQKMLKETDQSFATSSPSTSTDFSNDIVTNFNDPDDSQKTSTASHKGTTETNSVKKAGNNVCKHCQGSFKTLMALKMHIKFHHFKCGIFICAHCSVTANTEAAIVKHSQKQHVGKEHLAYVNAEVNTTEFNEEFWSENYGINIACETKYRSEAQPSEPPETPTLFTCEFCPFKTVHGAALKRHATSHKFTYCCGICNNFESDHSVDVRKHSEQVHPSHECVVLPNLKTDRPAKRQKIDEQKFSFIPKLQYVGAAAALAADRPSSVRSNSSVESASETFSQGASDLALTKNLYTCLSCNVVTEDRLKNLLAHWEAKHKTSSKDKFKYKTTQVAVGKQCRHCQMLVTSEKLMEEHFKQYHPEFVSITFSIYICNTCPYRTDLHPEILSHISLNHSHTPSDLPGFKTDSRVVNSQRTWFCCVHCHKFDSFNESEMINHCRSQHGELPAKFVVLTNTTQRVVREVGREDQNAGNMTVKAIHPHIKNENRPAKTPSPPGIDANSRKQYVCPECDVKTKTLMGMEEHVKLVHARLICLDCKQILVNDIASKMHYLVEHREPGTASQMQNIIKYDKDVAELMLRVTREGDNPVPPFEKKKKEDLLVKVEKDETEMYID